MNTKKDGCSLCDFLDRPHHQHNNLLAPDGYRYGVMWSDGSVTHIWNGSTQRLKAEAAAADWAEEYAPDHITLARRRLGEPWERV